jgi:hypothetical protein
VDDFELTSDRVQRRVDDLYGIKERLGFSYLQLVAVGDIPVAKVHYIGDLSRAIETQVDMSRCTVPEGDIPAYAFNGCGKVTSINLGSSIKAVKDHAFENCNNLTSITLGADVDVDAPNAFAGVGDGNFANAYDTNAKAAGTYTWNGSTWQH